MNQLLINATSKERELINQDQWLNFIVHESWHIQNLQISQVSNGTWDVSIQMIRVKIPWSRVSNFKGLGRREVFPYSISRLIKFPMESGIGPFNWLLLRSLLKRLSLNPLSFEIGVYKSFKLFRFPITLGIVPLNLLWRRHLYMRY